VIPDATLEALRSFWEGRELWQEPLLAGVLAAAFLSTLGVFVVLKRMVFVSAALSQASGVGVAVSFWLSAVAGIDPHSHGALPVWLDPSLFSLLFAVGGAVFFALVPGHRKIGAETAVGLLYIAASALVLVILNSPRIAQEAHTVGDILFGNAVVVPRAQIAALAVAGSLVLGVHGLFFKELLFSSYDPETSAVVGVGVRRWELLFNIGCAIVIATATRAVGALPVFAFTVVPAAAALLLTERLGPTFLLSLGFGVAAAVAGYVASWFLQLPTGATMVCAAAVFLLPGLLRLARTRGR
jgi:zinc transport system permease protein